MIGKQVYIHFSFLIIVYKVWKKILEKQNYLYSDL